METFIPRPRSKRKSSASICRDVHGSSDQSDDSIPSVVFPQPRRCRVSGNGGVGSEPLGLDKESHQVLNLYIFFTIVVQIVTACGVISIGVAFIVVNYRNGLLGDLQVNLSLYLFEASGMLFLIGSYLCSLNHNFDPIPVIKHLKTSLLFLMSNLVCLGVVIAWGLKTAFELKDQTLKKFHGLLLDFYKSAEAHAFLDDVQTRFDCCGIAKKEDWTTSLLELPPSCCRKFSSNGTCSDWKSKGCYEVYYARMYSFVHYVIGFGSVALAIVVIVLVPTLITLCFATKKRKLVNSLDSGREMFRVLNNVPESVQISREALPPNNLVKIDDGYDSENVEPGDQAQASKETIAFTQNKS